MATAYAEISGAEIDVLDGKVLGLAEPCPAPLMGVCHGGPQAKAKRTEVTFYAITKQGGALVALGWIATHSTGWIEWSGFALFWFLSVLAADLGFHRYFTHRSFETSRPMRWMLGIWVQLASYGSLRTLIADHRRHHARTDQPGDPHSPYFDGYGRPLTRLQGLRHAHLGWIFENTTTDLKVYGKGIVDDPVISFCHRTRIHWYGVSLFVLPAIWGYALGGAAAVPGTIMIAGFIRMAVALHAFALINSVGHLFGRKRYETDGQARNNPFVALVALGEGWHNNHHAHPRRAFHGEGWREVDITGYFIWLLEHMGLIWNVQRRRIAAH